jgi:hypothetical protein
MSKEFLSVIRKVRIRLGLNLLIHLTGWALIVCGIVYFPSILVEKLLAYSFLPSWALWTVFLSAIGAVLISWLFYFPRAMPAAILLDGCLGLKERVSTVLALAQSQDAFAKAACQEAQAAIKQINLKGHFPLRPGRCWLSASGIWIVLAMIAVFVPQQDLLGFLKDKKDQQERAIQYQAAQNQIQQSVSQVSTIVKQLGNSQLSSDLAKFELPVQGQLPDEAKRDAIKKLGDLSDRVKQLQNEQSPQMLASLEKMLSQLKAESADNPLKDMIQAMSKGNFSQAAAALQELQKQVEKGQLTPEQKQQMQKQFENLAKQLQQLAGQQKELEQELQKLGLDKKLAKASPEELKKMLEKQGYKPETIEQLMNKMKACQSAGRKCSGLGRSAGMCASGGGGESMEAMLSELNELDSFANQAKLSQAALDQIEQAMACLGEGMCQGVGGMCPYKPGQSQKYSSGTGGPGRGFGPRNKDDNGTTNSSPTQVKGKTVEEGPMIASWYFKDSQEKGQATKELKDVIQAGRDSAAQAMDENQIPKKYENAMKQYFGNLEEDSD